uniref:Uncharacterized protein n=1 Tax=Glossina pallidipes TaxID=7398 RepID=A0A1B0A4V5_GLOPL
MSSFSRSLISSSHHPSAYLRFAPATTDEGLLNCHASSPSLKVVTVVVVVCGVEKEEFNMNTEIPFAQPDMYNSTHYITLPGAGWFNVSMVQAFIPNERTTLDVNDDDDDDDDDNGKARWQRNGNVSQLHENVCIYLESRNQEISKNTTSLDNPENVCLQTNIYIIYVVRKSLENFTG